MGDLLRFLELVEQLADAIEILGGRRVDQVRLAADDQHRPPRMIVTPCGKTARDQLGGGGVDELLALADLGSEARFSFGERQSREARIDEVADLGQRARTGSSVQRNDAVLDTSVRSDQHGKRAARA